MRPSRTLIVLTAVLVGLPLLAVGTSLGLLWLGAFDGPVQRSLSRTLATPVTVERISLALASSPRIAVEGLRVGEEVPGGALIEDARATITFPWRALLGDLAHQRAVVLDAGRLNLRVDAAGRDNWTALVERVLELLGEGPSVFRVDSLETRDLRLRYEDARSGLKLGVAGFTMSATDVVPRQPFPVELRGGVSLDDWTAHGRLTGRATLDPDRGRHTIDLDRFTVWAGGGSLPLAGVEATGSITGLQYEFEADRVQVPRAQGTVAGVAFALKGTIVQATTDPVATFALKTAPFEPRTLAQALGSELPATTDPKALSRVQFAATVVANSESLEARDLDGTVDDTHIRGTARVPWAAGAAPGLVLHADRVDLDRYLPPAAGPAPRSKTTLEASLDALRDLDVDADIVIDEALAAGARFSGLRLRVEPNTRKAAP